MSDGGKGSSPRPLSVDYDKYIENWNKVFKKHLDEVEEMVRVSGVPYDVELPKEEPVPDNYDLISELERENFMLRSRTERLEDEIRKLEEELVILRIDLVNAKQGQYGS